MNEKDNKVRQFAIKALNDDHGINEESFLTLYSMLQQEGHSDILQCVEATDGRFYISFDDAEKLAQNHFQG